MRSLYRTFYKEKKRGFTDREFREVCERTAGSSLDEIFNDYAVTVKAMDYPKYLAYAGLAIDVEPREAAGAWFGASTRDQSGSPVVSSVEIGSPASLAGLSAQDEILALDGTRVTPRTLAEAINSRKPGDKIRVLYARRGRVQETEVVLGKKMERSFRINPLANPTTDEKALLDGWLRSPAPAEDSRTADQPGDGPGSVFLEDLTWVEAERVIKDYQVALIALGARTKEHGPHLLLKNDYLLAEYLLQRVSDEVPVIVLPTLQYGYYPAFLEYPGSISIGSETFKNLVMDICRSIHGYGMKKFYVLNTGVSTVGPLARAAEELALLGIRLHFLNILEVDKKLPAGLLHQEGGTHADEGETSMMLEIAPATVDMSKAVKDFDARPGRRA
jgi:creatinine amidohydrolase